MHGKTSYLILLSTMALFAALASQAKEPASSERSAVLSAVRSGNQAEYMKALERYNARLSAEFAPKAKAKPIRKPVAQVETNLPDDSKKTLPSEKPKDAVMAELDPALKKNYEDCLKSGPAECCRPMVDSHASLPMSCVNRGLASDGSSSGASAAAANSAM